MNNFVVIPLSFVGRQVIKAFGRDWRVADFIGSIFLSDIGKRIYLVGDILQVENDEQRAKRQETGDSPLEPCPYCASTRLENLDDRSGAVACIDCGARGPVPAKLSARRGCAFDNVSAWQYRRRLP